MHQPRRLEWPTLVLVAAVYGSWLAITWWHAELPWFVLFAMGGWTVAWHGSLQHELIHGHPTSLGWLNRLLGLAPLNPVLPFDRFRVIHLAHHRNEQLTDPLEDPESQYWTRVDWQRLGPVGRAIVRATSCLVGRVLIGPAWAIGRFLSGEAAQGWQGDLGVRTAWALHLGLVALLLVWLRMCDLGVGSYALCFVLPGVALLLLRSLAEHRAADLPGHRTAIVERAPVLGLLFLFNNLHAVHHARPGLPWYRLPAAYRADRARLIRENGGLVYRGYADVARRYFLRQHDTAVHPNEAQA